MHVLLYHAACKVELQLFNRSYSQLTFFNFLCNIPGNRVNHHPFIFSFRLVFSQPQKRSKTENKRGDPPTVEVFGEKLDMLQPFFFPRFNVLIKHQYKYVAGVGAFVGDRALGMQHGCNQQQQDGRRRPS